MPVTDYVAELQDQILGTPHVISHSLAYEDRPAVGVIIRGAVTFADGSCIRFKEFVQLRPHLARLKYAYHYSTGSQLLVFRYDNARDPDARRLPTYPDHRHSPDGLSSPNAPPLSAALHEAAAYVRRPHRQSVAHSLCRGRPGRPPFVVCAERAWSCSCAIPSQPGASPG